MGKVKIHYYVTRRAWPGSRETWGYWVPSKTMKAAGFHNVACGPDGVDAWAIAELWNARWQAYRRNEVPAAAKQRMVLPGSFAQAFERYRKSRTWAEKKARTREDWDRGWRRIVEHFGDANPKTITFELIDQWHAEITDTVSVREAWRARKIFRALWKVAASMGYCEAANDPSQGIRGKTPVPRNAIWFEGEAVRLVKGAYRMGYMGLAAALAVAWDTMLSPVDVRTLTRAQFGGDAGGPLFSVARAKTGKAAIGTFCKRTARLLEAYAATLPPNLHPSAPIFYTRGFVPGANGGKPRTPKPYTKDTLGDDFRAVRNALFPGDKRTLMDFRRSGAVEAKAGNVDPHALADKMANTIDRNKQLQSIYLPLESTSVRSADAARMRGRGKLRDGKS